MQLWGRIALSILLLGVVIGLIAHYDTARPAHERYPSPTEIEEEYDAHVGEDVLLWGEVESITESGTEATISVTTGNGPMTLTVEGFAASVRPGGNVQVYGTIQPGHTITANEVAVVNTGASSNLYKYAVSAVGALLILGQFFRYWRIDAGGFAFEVRTDG